MTADESDQTWVAPTPALPAVHTTADLVSRRQSMRMGVGDVAQRLKLSPRQIEALEAGDWASLPGHAFVRGALRGYGRLLGVDVAGLLEQVDSRIEPPRTSTLLREPMPRRGGYLPDTSGRRRTGLLRWIVLAAIVLAALTLFFGRSRNLSEIRSWIGGPADNASESSTGTTGNSSATVGGAGAGSAASSMSTPSAETGATPPPLVPSAPVQPASPGPATGVR